MKNACILFASLLCWVSMGYSQPDTVGIFFDDFETGYLNPAFWTAGSGPNGGLVEVQGGVGHESIFAVAMGRSEDGNLTTNTLDLHLNLLGYDEVELTFWIWDYNDETHAGDGLYFSDNGGAAFEKALDFKPGDWCEQYGQFPPIRLSKLAEELGLDLTAQFVIRFQQQGSFDFYGASDGLFIDDVNVYDPNTSYAILPFCDDFETGSLSSCWAWRFADETTVLSSFPTKPSNLAGVAGGLGYESIFAVEMGKLCDDGPVSNALDLHLDLQGQSQVELTFRIWDYNDETHVDDGIYFSDDGGETFEKVFNFKPGDWCEQYGQFPPLDVDALAAANGLALSDQFIIRFQQYGSNDFYGASDGLIIDDVCVYVPELVYKVPPFCDGFEDGVLPAHWARRFADKTTVLSTFPTHPSNFVGVVGGVGHESTFAVEMGKLCDDGPVSNALDLHLNLLGLPQVELTFWIWDYNDETHVDDGIYFSDDGGETFEKVFNFKPGDWCEQYGQFPPLDVDALAAAHDLALTGQFIIRFQQYGSYDFYGASDGLIIDDVCVYVPDVEYKTPPFCDDFETGAFSNAWTWPFVEAIGANFPQTTRPSNMVAVLPGQGYNSIFAAAMGKRCDDGAATNALDLHLNLLGLSQIDLSFLLYDYQDETNLEDGIWFSDDGGETYVQVATIDPGNTPNLYHQYTIDVDEFAASQGLSLTDRFIIRFQQHGSYDFYGTSDGFFLDNVCVGGMLSGTEEKLSVISDESIRLFPNPVSATLRVSMEGSVSGFSRMSIFDMNGVVHQEHLLDGAASFFEVDVSILSDGIYFIRLENEREVASKKFVKISE